MVKMVGALIFYEHTVSFFHNIHESIGVSYLHPLGSSNYHCFQVLRTHYSPDTRTCRSPTHVTHYGRETNQVLTSRTDASHFGLRGRFTNGKYLGLVSGLPP